MAKDPAPTVPQPINPSPKLRFVSEGRRVTAHRNVMQSEVLRESLDFALLHYQHYLSLRSGDANAAAQNMIKQCGALEFIDLLYKLAEPMQEAPTSAKIAQLDHRA